MSMKRILASLAAAVALTAALAGCANPPTHGYVWARQYNPPSSWYVPGYWYTSCYGSGSSRYCYEDYSPGYWVYYPAEWQFDLCSEPIGKQDKQNNCGWRDVAEDDYTRYALNSWYTVDPKYPYPVASKKAVSS